MNGYDVIRSCRRNICGCVYLLDSYYAYLFTIAQLLYANYTKDAVKNDL